MTETLTQAIAADAISAAVASKEHGGDAHAMTDAARRVYASAGVTAEHVPALVAEIGWSNLPARSAALNIETAAMTPETDAERAERVRQMRREDGLDAPRIPATPRTSMIPADDLVDDHTAHLTEIGWSR